jgi:predicted HTH transcriptional regulator
MKSQEGLDLIQSAFLELTSSIGLTIDEMNEEVKDDGQFEWFIDYENSLNERYEYNSSKLLRYFDIHRKARKNNDQLTAFAALLFAGVSAHNLKNIFENIEAEIDKVMFRDPRFTWPDIPEGYKFPEDYLEEKS